MSKKLNYYIELLKIPEEKYKINSDGTITISDLNITLQKTKTIVYPPPETPKKKNKRMTDKQIAELIDKKIAENNKVNNTFLLKAIKQIVNEAIAPVIEKLDTVIKLNNLKTK